MPTYISDNVPENAVIAPYLTPIDCAGGAIDPMRPTPSTIPPLPTELADVDRRTIIGDPSGYPVGVGVLADCDGAMLIPHGKWHYIIYTDATYPELKHDASRWARKPSRGWYLGVLDIVQFPQHLLYDFATRAQGVNKKTQAIELLARYMPEGIAKQVFHYAVRATTKNRIGKLEQVVKAKLAAEGRSLEPSIEGDWAPIPIINLGKAVEATIAINETAHFASEWISTGWVSYAPGKIRPAVFIVPAGFVIAVGGMVPYMLYQWKVLNRSAIALPTGEELYKDALPVVPRLSDAIVMATRFSTPGAYTPPPETSDDWVTFRVAREPLI